MLYTYSYNRFISYNNLLGFFWVLDSLVEMLLSFLY
jgi:hypothetical protein